MYNVSQKLLGWADGPPHGYRLVDNAEIPLRLVTHALIYPDGSGHSIEIAGETELVAKLIAIL